MGSHVDVVPALGVVALQFPFSGAEAVVATFAVVQLEQLPAALGAIFAVQRVPDIEAVGAGILRKFDPREGGETGGEVDGADHFA